MAAQRDLSFEQWYQRRYGVGPLWVNGSGYAGVSAERHAGWAGSREALSMSVTPALWVQFDDFAEIAGAKGEAHRLIHASPEQCFSDDVPLYTAERD